MERKTRLEETIEALERERTGLVATLRVSTLTHRQVQTIREFAAEIATTLDIADTSFEARRRVIELLNVRATLAVEDGQKVVHAQGCLDRDDLSVEGTTVQSGAHKAQDGFILTARLVLPKPTRGKRRTH